MVGVGPEGAESSLARVSLVNYYGAVQLDAFVRQRERVVDYRTEFSGVRETDMIHARPFDEIQKQVAALLKDRVLVGHAVFNDLKVLLLSHPRPQTRDTQYYAGKFKIAKSKYVALRTLVKQELDATIQGGEHSSVTDARATMAVYRLHRREWEKGSAPLIIAAMSKRRAEEEGA
ncbi:ribonuclease H-like domain-containing protein [Mycena crocata]|nr:ribonuclease H-like domain-containing protein [Mycena crocata]